MGGAKFYNGVDGTRVVNTQTGATYTYVLADNGKCVDGDRATAQTFTIPPVSSVAWPVGAEIEGGQLGVGQITIAGGVGVTFKGTLTKTADQGSVYGIRHLGSDVWLRYGRLVA